MWDADMDVVIAGAGGCGLIAALAAAEKGLEVCLLEKTEFVLGNTSMSAGMIPAAGTRFQKELGIYETPEEMAEDILKKNHYESDPELTLALCRESAPLVEWIVDSLKIELSIVREFSYPGQRNIRMHAPNSRSGMELIKKLKQEVSKRDNIYLILKSEIVELLGDENQVRGVVAITPNGKIKVKAKKVILATNGFGANKEMVQKHIPEIANAYYFGYEGSTGDAIRMGEEIGADIDNLSAYQGHSAVAQAQAILVTWGTIMMGGYMVNEEGKRFGDEPQGYSEFATEVLNQPGQHGYIIFDQEIYQQLLSIEDFKVLSEKDSFKKGETIEELAEHLKLNKENMKLTYNEFNRTFEERFDPFGRTVLPKKISGRLYGIKVVPALFHTQGGLKINSRAQVINKKGNLINNLYAGGGAAVGVSGKGSYGYMSGNGLLSALGFGKIAGDHAAQSILSEQAKDNNI